MVNIKIICVGEIKENFLSDAIKEYLKRLSRYCKISVIEVKDEASSPLSGNSYAACSLCMQE